MRTVESRLKILASSLIIRRTWCCTKNVQKVELNISRTNLVNEAFEFKIAVGCRRHGNLSDAQSISLPKSYDYSLVIRIKENLPANQLNNRLFDELVSLNELEILGRLDLDADLEAEADAE